MYKPSKFLWGIEIHFKSGDVIFVDNKNLLMMKLTDIKTDYLSYSTEVEFRKPTYCSRVYLKVSNHLLNQPQKDGFYNKAGKSLIDLISEHGIEMIRVIDGQGEGTDIVVPWKSCMLSKVNALQKQRIETGDLVIEIGGQ